MPIPAAPFEFDPTNEVHARSLTRLATEKIGWLVTAGRDGYPHVVPVWFLWRDGRVLILSEPHTVKVRNLRADPRVAFHLEAGDDGEQVMVLRGTAAISPEPALAWLDRIGEEYDAMYGGEHASIGRTMHEMAESYSTVIEVTPWQLIAW